MSTLIRTVLSLSLAGILSSTAVAQTFALFSEFQALSPTELATVQVKITYLGPSDSPVGSLAFSCAPNAVDPYVFRPFRRTEFSPYYDFASTVFQVAPDLLHAMIDSVGTLAGVTDGGVDSSGYVSFAMLKTVGGTRVFESIVDETNGRLLIAKMQAAFSGDANALRLTTECGCRMSLLYDNPPAEVTQVVSVKCGGFRQVRKSDQYAARVRVTNSSGVTLQAPVTLLPGIIGENVELVGEGGWTCAIEPGGEAYLTLPTGSGGLAPGAHVDITLHIKNPSMDRIRVQPQVFAGPGTR